MHFDLTQDQLSIREAVTQLCTQFPESYWRERDIDGVFEGDYDESFTLDLVTKDLGLAVDLGRELGVPLELSALVEQLHRRARALYGDRAGELSAVRLVEEAAGIKLRLGEP